MVEGEGSGIHEKVERVQSQVDEVVGIMHSNIGKVLERGEKIEELDLKTVELQSQAKIFKKGAKRVRKQMWCRNLKLNMIIGGICFLILIAIALSLYFTFRPK